MPSAVSSRAFSPPSFSSSSPSLPDTAAPLLDGFTQADIFFASPDAQWRARAQDGVVSAHVLATRANVDTLFAQAAQRKAAHPVFPVLFGLIPFDTRSPASLSIPLRVERAPAPRGVCATPDAHAPKVLQSVPVPPPEVYGDMVRRALALLDAGGLEKIVPARAMDITLDRRLDFVRLLTRLLAGNRRGYTFALPVLGDQGMCAGMMTGASPELLVRRTGDQVTLNPLAGSIGRHPDPDTDARLRAGLAASGKDLREHAYVVADIACALRQHCVDLQIPDQPSVIGTDTLWHLSTTITGRLRDVQTTALDLACALHPTPAICGTPTAAAQRHLAALEPFDREYYGGLAGWQLPDGDGEWALTLRCARHTDENRLRLYAGAGVVRGSDPEREIVETEIKMETFLRALR